MSIVQFASSAYALDDSTKERVAHARAVLEKFPLWKLKGAEVYKHEEPDTTNPSGYYHRGVSIKYRTWFGFALHESLYWEMTASDETDQEAVFAYAHGVVAAVNSVL